MHRTLLRWQAIRPNKTREIWNSLSVKSIRTPNGLCLNKLCWSRKKVKIKIRRCAFPVVKNRLFFGQYWTETEIVTSTKFDFHQNSMFIFQRTHRPRSPRSRPGCNICHLPDTRRKIRLMQSNVKCRYLKKLTCKGNLRQVFYLSKAPTPYLPPPPSLERLTANAEVATVLGAISILRNSGIWGVGSLADEAVLQ